MIEKDAGIRLPEVGIRTNQETIRVAANVADGRLAPTPIQIVEPVGSFTDKLSIKINLNEDFREVLPGGIRLDFVIRPEMDILRDERIIFTLPGIGGNDSTCFLVSSYPMGKVIAGSWSRQASRLEFTVATPVLRKEDVTLTVSSKSSANFPVALVQGPVLNEVSRFDFLVETNAKNGPVLSYTIFPKPVKLTVPVPASTIAFKPAQAGTRTQIIIRVFTPVSLHDGVRISLRLSGFEGMRI